MKSVFCFVILFVAQIQAQLKDPDQIISLVTENFDRIEDYQVNVNINVDIEFIKVPQTNAKIYFKKPDKIKLESDGFAMLPKEGLNFSPNSLLQKKYTAIYEQDVELEGFNTSIVKVIPLGDQGDVILTTLWIDQKAKVIRKVESTTKTNGTFNIDLNYNPNLKYPLPDKMVFSFNLDKLSLPTSITGEQSDELSTKNEKRRDSRTKGKVIVNYSDYKINLGIEDTIFEEKKN